MAVAATAKRIVVSIGSHLYTFLVELADAWYQNQLDALSVIGDVIRSRASSYSDVERSVREAIFASETEDWRNKKDIVKRDLETRMEHLCVVYDMLTTMGLSEIQADTVLGLLCSDKKIPDNTRDQMVSLYKDCLTLEPFTKGDGIMPIEGANNVIKTCQREKMLRFLMCVQSCLPITNKTEQLEDALTKAVMQISNEKIKSGLMHASGVVTERCHANATVNVPETKKYSKQKKQVTFEQNNTRYECAA